MPSSSSFWAMTSLSSTEKETDSPCVPSRRVVSKVKIFMLGTYRPRTVAARNHLILRYSGFFSLLQKRHHFAKLAADLLDGLGAGGVAHGQKFVPAGLVFVDPLAGKLTGLDLSEDLFHFGAGLLVDDARNARVITVLGRVGDGIA